MRKIKIGAASLAILLASVLTLSSQAQGQVVERGRTLADLIASHPCDTGLTNRIARVTDCDAADDLGDGEGAFQCWAYCDGSAPWAAVSIGGGSGGTGDVLLAGDADGQTIQGRSGSDEARVDIGEGQPYEARMIGGGATPAFAFVDNAYFSAQSPDTNSSIQVTDGSVQISSDAAVGLSVLPTGAYFGASATSFYAGSPDSTNTIDVSNAAVRILYSQTPPTDADDPCTAGDTIDTATFHYYCAATDTWVRAAMATW